MKDILKIWKEKDKILEGLKNKVFKDEFVEVVSRERFAVCNKCPELDTTGDKCMVPLTQPCCSVCGCSLALKTRALSAECDLKKWDAIMSLEDEIKLDTNEDNI